MTKSMTLKMFSIYDSKAEAYLTPFFAPTSGVALRMFESSCQDASHAFHKFGGDYTLFEIGEFDINSGAIFVKAAMDSLANGLRLGFKVDTKERTVDGEQYVLKEAVGPGGGMSG